MASGMPDAMSTKNAYLTSDFLFAPDAIDLILQAGEYVAFQNASADKRTAAGEEEARPTEDVSHDPAGLPAT